MTELRNFESTLAREIEAFELGEPERRRAKVIARPAQGITVRLAVREHRLAPDQILTHESESISRLQARLEAEQAARARGLTVGYVIDYQSR